MTRILIFGNSGSGKSTLASRLCRQSGLAHLDLDTLAWLPDTPLRRRPLTDCEKLIGKFTSANENWVIEGCYGDILQLLSNAAEEAVFLDVPVSHCVDNARRRPFEPHKYSSEAAQNNNLSMLIQWIQDYPSRADDCSLSAHRKLLAAFEGRKSVLSSRAQVDSWQAL